MGLAGTCILDRDPEGFFLSADRFIYQDIIWQKHQSKFPIKK